MPDGFKVKKAVFGETHEDIAVKAGLSKDDMLSAGVMRITPKGAEIRVKPTDNQIEQLKAHIQAVHDAKSPYDLDIYNDNGEHKHIHISRGQNIDSAIWQMNDHFDNKPVKYESPMSAFVNEPPSDYTNTANIPKEQPEEISEKDRIINNINEQLNKGFITKNKAKKLIDATERKYAKDNKPPKMIETFGEKMAEGFSDRNLPIAKIVELVKTRGGKIDPNTSDPALAEKKFRGSVVQQAQEFDNYVLNPLIDAWAEIEDKTGKSYDEIDLFVQSQHAPSRNQKIAKDKKEKYDPKTTNYSGWTTEEAEQYNAEFRKDVPKELIDELNLRVREATKFSIDELLNGGVINKETHDKILSQWENYVPLRGFNEKDYMGDYWDFADSDKKGEGNKTLKKAKGRNSKAIDVLANIQDMAHNAIVQKEKNKYLTAAYYMVRKNMKGNEDLFSLEWVHLIDSGLKDANGESIIIEQNNKITDEQLASGMKEVEITPNYFRKFIEYEKANQKEVYVKIKGIPVKMIFNDPSVANALKQNNKLQSAEAFKTFYNTIKISQLTRWMAMNITGLDPRFFIPNGIRDYQMAISKIPAKYIPLFTKNLGFAEAALARHYSGINVYNTGYKIDINGKKEPIDKLLYNFRTNGGMTGWVHQKQVNEINQNVRKLVASKADEIEFDYTKMFKDIKTLLENSSSTIENATRFATYITHLQMGKSDTEAINEAKNISVNFENEGKWTDFFAPIYYMSRAGINGVYNWTRFMKQHPGKSAGLFAGFIALGFYAAWLNNGDDEDDDKRDEQGNPLNKKTVWKNTSKYLKYNYFPVITDDLNTVTVPLSYGWRFPYQVGVMAYEFKKGNMTAEEFAYDFTEGLANAFSPISPLGFISRKGGFQFRPIIPSAVTPFYDVATNSDFTGRPVRKESGFMKYPEKVQQRGLYLKDTNPIFIKFTDYVGEMGGMNTKHKYRIVQDPKNKGDVKEISTWYDWNPAVIEHLLSGYFGGPFVFAKDMAQFGYNVANNKDVQYSKIPVISRFIRSPFYDDSDKELMFLRKKWNEIKQREEVFNIGRSEYMKNNEYDQYKELSLTDKNRMYLNGVYKATENILDDLTKQINSGDLTQSQEDSLINDIKGTYKKGIEEYKPLDK